MIAQNTLRIDHAIDQVTERSQPIYLAPFGEADLAQVMPLNTDNLYFPKSSTALYAQDPAALLATHDSLEHSQNWGIYQGEVSPEAFQGVASLTEATVGEPNDLKYTHLVQETGLYIMRSAGRYKGLGSLARFAMMSYALEAQGTRAFQSLTSEHNTAAQRSLAKAGFTLLDTFPNYIDFAKGEATQFWAAAHPDAHASIASNSLEANALAAGWQHYEAQRQQLDMTEL